MFKKNQNNFEKQFNLIKKQALEKLDKSNIGQIDKKIQNLCDIINNRDDMFSLSSCSGRFSINKINNNFKKEKNCWIYTSHEIINFENFKKILLENFNENKLDLRCEAMILHICVKNLQIASNLMHISKISGCNQVGIIAFKNKLVVEIICDSKLITPIYDLKFLVNEQYLQYLINKSNLILKRSWRVISKLEQEIKNL